MGRGFDYNDETLKIMVELGLLVGGRPFPSSGERKKEKKNFSRRTEGKSEGVSLGHHFIKRQPLPLDGSEPYLSGVKTSKSPDFPGKRGSVGRDTRKVHNGISKKKIRGARTWGWTKRGEVTSTWWVGSEEIPSSAGNLGEKTRVRRSEDCSVCF